MKHNITLTSEQLGTMIDALENMMGSDYQTDRHVGAIIKKAKKELAKNPEYQIN